MKRYVALALLMGLNSFSIQASDSKERNEPKTSLIKKYSKPKPIEKITFKSHWDNPLFSAIRFKDLQAFKKYIAQGGNANAKLSPLDETLLQYAAYFGAANIFNYLLDNGADPKLSFANDGKTLLMWVAHYNIDEQNYSSGEETPLVQDKIAIMNIILKRGLDDINAQDKQGKTALDIAIETRRDVKAGLDGEIINTLLKNNALRGNNLLQLKMIGLQGQPPFSEIWVQANTKEERGRALIYLFNAIKEQLKDNKQAKEFLDNFKQLFQENLFKISDYARELIDKRIKEIAK